MSSSVRLVALLSLFLLVGEVAGQGYFPIVVENPSPYARYGEPVASGFAVPRSMGIHDPTLYRLEDTNGQAIPVQYKVLSRWGGTRDDVTKPCKWVLVMFVADVPAAGSKTFLVRHGAGASANITTATTSGAVRVSTGAATFSVSRNVLGGLQCLDIGGSSVVSPTGGIRVLDESAIPASTAVTSTVIEEAGDVRTVILQRGSAPQVGIDFTLRYYFWTDRSDVRVDLRVENPGGYGLFTGSGTEGTAHFERVAFRMRTPQAITSVSSSTGTRALSGNIYRLDQDWSPPSNPADQLSGFEFQEHLDGAMVSGGARHHGALGATDGQLSIAMSVDRFWQNFPKAFRVGATDAIDFELFPAFGNGPVYTGPYGTPNTPGTVDPLSLNRYRFEGGRWKSHSFVVDFTLNGAHGPLALKALSARTNAPLMARPWNLDHTFSDMVFGEPIAARRNWNTPDRQRFEQMMDILVRDSAADVQSGLGAVGFPAFRDRGGTYGGEQFFGWVNYGDIVWADGYASLHYDMPFGVLVNWFRTGDYQFVDIGRDLAAHRRDYDQDHSQDTQDAYRGGQFYEKGWFHGNFTEPTVSHTWLHGLLVHYVMTGDEGSREAAIQTGDFIMRTHPETWGGLWGSRIPGWALEGLVNLWNYVGDPAYLTVAQATIANWTQIEQAQGGHGCVINNGYSNPHAQTWMQMIMFNAMAKYFYATGDVSVRPVMNRMADWYLNECFEAMPGPPWSSSPVVRVWERVAPGYHSDPSVHHGWVTSAALTNAAACLIREDCAIAALSVWRSLTRYHQVSAATTGLFDYDDPNSWSVIAYRMFGFPESESKIHSNIALWGHAGMWLASLLVP